MYVVNDRGVRVKGTWAFSVPSLQVFCKSKTILKMKMQPVARKARASQSMTFHGKCVRNPALDPELTLNVKPCCFLQFRKTHNPGKQRLSGLWRDQDNTKNLYLLLPGKKKIPAFDDIDLCSSPSFKSISKLVTLSFTGPNRQTFYLLISLWKSGLRWSRATSRTWCHLTSHIIQPNHTLK